MISCDIVWSVSSSNAIWYDTLKIVILALNSTHKYTHTYTYKYTHTYTYKYTHTYTYKYTHTYTYKYTHTHTQAIPAPVPASSA